MQSENKLFDDFVKMVNGVAGTMAGVGRESGRSGLDCGCQQIAHEPLGVGGQLLRLEHSVQPPDLVVVARPGPSVDSGLAAIPAGDSPA